jgi:hypothetical protein
MKNKLKVDFTDFWGGFDPNHNFWTIMFNKLNIPYEVVNYNSDLLISSCFGANWYNKKYNKRLFWTGENWFRMDTRVQQLDGNRIIDFFDKVYSFDYNNYENHYRLPLWLIDCIESNIIDFNKDLRLKNKDQLFLEFKSKKFCTFVQGNGNCEFRNQFFHNLSEIEIVDSFGPLFNNTGQILDRPGKIDKTKSYKFSLSFENSEYDGYVSEKIIDAFKSDVIPIYWGGTKISQEFNDRSFIDVNQLGMNKSIELVKELNNNFDLYWEYYNQKIISDNQKPLEKIIEEFEDNFLNFINSI